MEKRKSKALSLTVETVLGESISQAMDEACELARTLSLHHVSFRTNGSNYTAYPNSTVMQFTKTGAIQWTPRYREISGDLVWESKSLLKGAGV